MRKSTKENVDITTGLNLVYLAFSIFLLEEMNNDRLQFRFCFSILPPDGGAFLNNLPGYYCFPLLAVCLFIKKTNRIEGENSLDLVDQILIDFQQGLHLLAFVDKPAMIRDVNVLEEVLCSCF